MKKTRCGLTVAVREALATGPFEAGVRLTSERRLASALGMTTARVRRTMRELVAEGVLVQEHGRGTFVRAIPPASAQAVPDEARIDPNVLLPHMSAKAEDLARSEQQRTGLQIGLWWDGLVRMSPVQQTILSGIVECAERRGHQLSLHDLRSHQGGPTSVRELARRLANSPRDLILAPVWAESTLLKAMADKQLAGAKWPVSLFSTWSWEKEVSFPLVAFDSAYATRQAFRHLVQAGARRLAVVLMDSPAHQVQGATVQDIARQFGNSTEAGGETLCEPVWLDLYQPDDDKALAALFNGNDVPDGIVVTDDHLVARTLRAAESAGRRPGRHFAMVVYSNRGFDLPATYDFSRLEFDPKGFGTFVLDSALDRIQRRGTLPAHIAIRPTWIRGRTAALDGSPIAPV